MKILQLLLLLIALSAGGQATATQPLILGVTTHFGQGWPATYWPLLERTPAKTVRDGVAWRLIESEQGTYTFSARNSGHIDRICAMGRSVVLGIEPRNPLYDNGETIVSSIGREAFANYVAALARRYGRCLIAVEIGNEINGQNAMTGPASLNRNRSHADLIGAVKAALKRDASETAVLAGSVNTVGTGFLTGLFMTGVLADADGIAVHPYRQDPANLDWELSRLKAAMAARGPVRQIWATEFSKDFSSPNDAAPFLLKMATLMSASGIEQALWYALVDQPGFPTMGLYTRNGVAKPGADAFAYFANELASRGAAIDSGRGARGVHLYRFGNDRHVLWGDPRPVRFGPGMRARDAAGRPVPMPVSLSDTPLIIEGTGPITLGETSILADSLTDFGRDPWTYFGGRPSRPVLSLRPIDWTWTSFIGDPKLRPAAINQSGLTVTGNEKTGVRLTLRYTADRTARGFASACLSKSSAAGDGVDFSLVVNGNVVLRRIIDQQGISIEHPVQFGAGDQIDFVFGPNITPGGDAIRQRLRIATSRTDSIRC